MSDLGDLYNLSSQVHLEHADASGNPTFVQVGGRSAMRFGGGRLVVLHVDANENGVVTLHLTKGEARRIAHLLLAEVS